MRACVHQPEGVNLTHRRRESHLRKREVGRERRRREEVGIRFNERVIKIKLTCFFYKLQVMLNGILDALRGSCLHLKVASDLKRHFKSAVKLFAFVRIKSGYFF